MTELINQPLTLIDALVNTCLSMATVFIVLIFISFVIYLLGKVAGLIQSISQKKTNEVVIEQSEVKVSRQEPKNKTTDDFELVAVITSAIEASMEQAGLVVPEDGLVIRSIKRRGYGQ